MRNPFRNSQRRLSGRPVTWWAWLGLIIVPVLVVGLLSGAFWAPAANHGTAKVAVVNDDEPADINGQMAPLGREMAAKMANSTDSGYSWEMTSASDAEQGLQSGDYSAVVTIPKDFSTKAVTSMSGEPKDAKQAVINVRTSPSAPPADAAATESSLRQSVGKFNSQVIGMYVNGLLGGFSQMHDQMGTVSDGANKLADGSRQLADGNGQLAEGTHGLADGTGQLSDAAHQLDGGAGQLTNGIGQLSGGSGQLAGGLTQMEQQTAQLPQLTQQLADGAKQVANGNRQVANTITPIADQIIKLIDALPSTDKSNDRVSGLAEKCPATVAPEFCDQLKSASGGLSQDTSQVTGLKTKLRDAAMQAKNASEGLAYGSEQVANGNQQLADKMPELTGGISATADGSRQLDGGIKALHDGAGQLSGGMGQFAGGVDQLDGGVGQLAGGADQLAGGSDQLAGGNRQLADGLNQAGDKIPHYSDEERDHLKDVVASPAAFDSSSQNFGKAMTGLLVALALWAGALATYLLTRAVPEDLVTSRKPTWKIVGLAALPGTTASVATATVLSAVLAPILDLSFAQWASFFGIAVLGAVSFVALNQALSVLFKRAGSIVSIAVLVLTLATGIISTVPGFFDAAAAVLPTHGASQALNAVLTGSDGAVSGVVQLVAWLAAGVVASVVATERARALPAKQLRFT